MAKRKKTEVVNETPEKDNDDSPRSKAINVAINQLKKKFGDATIDTLKSVGSPKRDVISTGSLSLDNALGVGGVVRGRLYEVFGLEASGKSTLAFSVMREAVKKKIRCLYLDVERTLDNDLLEETGIDTEYVYIVHAFTGEEYLDIADALLSTGEFGLCVLDSITALLPTAEADQDSYGDQSMGLLGRLTSKMCRNLIPLSGKTNTALIVINQLRDTMSTYSGPTTTGGKSIPFYASGRIKVSGSGGFKSSRIQNSDGVVIGHKVQFEVIKNKLATPFKTAQVDLIYGEGYDTYGEVFDLAVDMGLIDKAGSWYSVNGDKIGQGKDNALGKLKEDPELFESIKKDVLGILNMNNKNE